MLSRSVITYSAPSAPLAGTSRFHRLAAYTPCLRCAGAPRRPASGSGLSLSILSWHAVLNDPGEFGHRHGPGLRCRLGLRRGLNSSALPLIPQSVSRGARISGLPGSLALRPVRWLAPLRRIRPGLPSPRGLLLPGFQQVGRPSCRWISLQQVLNSFCWRDFHPLEWQLASLHQTRTCSIPASGSSVALASAQAETVTDPSPVCCSPQGGWLMLIQPYMSGMSFLCGLRASVRSFPL
jgi:hypothetical protein